MAFGFGFGKAQLGNGSQSPVVQRFTVAHTAFQTAALTNNIELFSLPAKALIERVVIKHSASFTGGAISAYTLSVGIAGTLAKYAAAFNVFQAPGATVLQLTQTEGIESFGAATSIRIAATSTTANLNASTGGSVDVYVFYRILN